MTLKDVSCPTLRAGGRAVGARLRDLTTPGLSLRATSTAAEATGASERGQDRVYREAAAQFDSRSETLLKEYAEGNGYSVPSEWVFEDEGYSGAILLRPGLEALRDLAAEGQIEAALVYSPDRLSRKHCPLAQ